MQHIHTMSRTEETLSARQQWATLLPCFPLSAILSVERKYRLKVSITPYGNGWSGMAIGLKRTEIEEMIRSLQLLKSFPDHFHAHSKSKGNGGVADIEFSIIPDDTQDNMRLDSMG